MDNIIFVFGSNLAGRHGKGSAAEAWKNWGAIYGKGCGRMGMSYAIPTKNTKLQILSLIEIENYVNEFLIYAKKYPNLTFKIVKIGCGLAGYKEEQIKPMFKSASFNCDLPEGWR